MAVRNSCVSADNRKQARGPDHKVSVSPGTLRTIQCEKATRLWRRGTLVSYAEVVHPRAAAPLLPQKDIQKGVVNPNLAVIFDKT